MKKLIFISINLITLLSCSHIFHKEIMIDNGMKINISKEITIIVDSLKKSKIDTILIYQKRCNGCIKGFPSPAYIFWLDKGLTKVIKINEYKKYLKPQTIKNIFSYFFSKEGKIIDSKLIEPEIFFLHYHSTFIKLFIYNEVLYHYDLPDYYLIDQNMESSLLKWVYYIESNLFNIERDQFGAWRN